MTPEEIKKDRDKWEAHALRLEEEMMRLRKEITTRQENNFGLHRRNVRLQTELCAAKCTLAKWIEGSRKAVNASPWINIGELGQIDYMEDGSHRWKLLPGYEDMRIFLIYLSSGEVETHLAYIDDGGTLCDEHGDEVGWSWYDAEYFMDIPARPSSR